MRGQNTRESNQVEVGNYVISYNQILGKGTTGIVYKGYIFFNLGYQIHTRSPIAVKVIQLSTIKDDATRSLL